MSKIKSTAKINAVSITTKTGTRIVMRPTNPVVFIPRIEYLLRVGLLDDKFHECDFVGTRLQDRDGGGIEVCSCGRTRRMS